MNALNDINTECAKEIQEFKNGFSILKGAYAPFGGLLNKISTNWNKQDLSANISNAVSSFDMNVFSELN